VKEVSEINRLIDIRLGFPGAMKFMPKRGKGGKKRGLGGKSVVGRGKRIRRDRDTPKRSGRDNAFVKESKKKVKILLGEQKESFSPVGRKLGTGGGEGFSRCNRLSF